MYGDRNNEAFCSYRCGWINTRMLQGGNGYICYGMPRAIIENDVYVGLGIAEVECIRTGKSVFCNMAMPID